MATPKQTDPQFKLRFTPELRDQIEATAKANNRSMNAEIVERLEDSFTFPSREARHNAKITELSQEAEGLYQEINELTEEIRHREKAKIDYLAEIRMLRIGRGEFDQELAKKQLEIDHLRAEAAEIRQILRNYVAHSERLQGLNEQVERLTKGLVVYGRAFELSHDGDQARALDILDKAIDDVEKQERREKDTPEKKAG